MNTNLTPEQKEQIRLAKAAGEKRVNLHFTSEQKSQWESDVARELASRDENIEHFRKIKAAAAQVGFSGDLRRAIILANRPIAELAAEIGVDARLLSDFRAGEAELPSATLDRLVDALGLQLMRIISRT